MIIPSLKNGNNGVAHTTPSLADEELLLEELTSVSRFYPDGAAVAIVLLSYFFCVLLDSLKAI
jgi:hypothetical protein